ncbi:hypothetical protein FRC06_001858 [Ceratobasidium sp. 370]|nr:hypothetical protein FRC06_001858 [Ceratobasidium sp. 370]
MEDARPEPGLVIKVMLTRESYIICAGALRVPVTVVIDAVVTTTILWRLQSWRGATRRTNHLLKKLMQITFESQLPPTLIAIAILAIYTIRYDSFVMVPLIWLQPKMYGISLLHTLNIRPTIAQPTVVFGTIYSAPSCTTSNDGRRFTVALAGTAQTEPNLISHNNTVGASQSRSHFSTQNEPPKPTVVSFDEESVLTTPGDTLTVDVIPMVSHRRSSDVGMEMVERNSKLPDSESRPPIAG